MYLSYYSKIKPSFIPNEDGFEKERNKIVTKIITADSAVEPKDIARINNNSVSLYNKSINWIDRHPNRDDCYTKFKIPKASGGYRTILAPDDYLKEMQSNVQKFIVKDCRFLSHNAAYGFVKHRNCLTSMQMHKNKGSRWFLKLDIKDFFPSITMDMTLNAIANTYPFPILRNDQTWVKIITPCFMNNNTLPQGSPASPVLSNLVMLDCDYKIAKAFPTLTYTRYADDLILSSATHFDWRLVRNTVAQILYEAGFQLNKRKIRYGNCNGSNWNLGLMYNGDLDITVGYKQKKLLKNKIHNHFRDKPETEPELWEWQSKLASLAGILSYYRFIEPEYFSKLIDKYEANGKYTELVVAVKGVSKG